jgi:hypothetical protein
MSGMWIWTGNGQRRQTQQTTSSRTRKMTGSAATRRIDGRVIRFMNDTSSVVSNASLQWTCTGSCCDEALDPGNIPPHDRVLCPSNVEIVSIIETSRSTDRPSPESQVELVPPAQTANPVVPSPSYISQSTSEVGKRSLDQSFSTTDVRHGS